MLFVEMDRSKDSERVMSPQKRAQRVMIDEKTTSFNAKDKKLHPKGLKGSDKALWLRYKRPNLIVRESM